VIQDKIPTQDVWLNRVPSGDRDLCLFMFAAKWQSDIRKKIPQYDKPKWHYFKFGTADEKTRL
jgi:hypothetical protein